MISIQIPPEVSLKTEDFVEYLNNHIDQVKKGIHMDMSHLLTGAISETPKITLIDYLPDNEITLHYEFKWFIHNLCLNIIDDNIEKGSFTAKLKGQELQFHEALSSNSRSTADEL